MISLIAHTIPTFVCKLVKGSSQLTINFFGIIANKNVVNLFVINSRIMHYFYIVSTQEVTCSHSFQKTKMTRDKK